MKVQANANLSAFFDDRLPHHEYSQDDVIEMVVEDGVASVPKPSPMLGYRPLNISGVIVEDRLPPSPILVSAKYEATAKLVRS